MGMWEYRLAVYPDEERADTASAIRLLTEQVERGRGLTTGPSISEKDVDDWIAETIACLVKVYGRGSPNTFSVDATPGADAAWAENRGKIFGGRREIADRYLSSTIQERARLLEQCIVALRFARDEKARIFPAIDSRPETPRAKG